MEPAPPVAGVSGDAHAVAAHQGCTILSTPTILGLRCPVHSPCTMLSTLPSPGGGPFLLPTWPPAMILVLEPPRGDLAPHRELCRHGFQDTSPLAHPWQQLTERGPCAKLSAVPRPPGKSRQSSGFLCLPLSTEHWIFMASGQRVLPATLEPWAICCLGPTAHGTSVALPLPPLPPQHLCGRSFQKDPFLTPGGLGRD